MFIFFVGGLNLIYQTGSIPKRLNRDAAHWFSEASSTPPPTTRVQPRHQSAYLDTNYAGVLLPGTGCSGTFVPELDDDKPVYGNSSANRRLQSVRHCLSRAVRLPARLTRAMALRPTLWVRRSLNAPGWGRTARNIALSN